MMHNTCLNSDASLRRRSPLSLAFEDSTYFLDSRFRFNSFFISSSLSASGCCCCCCCASNNSIYNRVPTINPSFLYSGLRQSTLIQWSPCKRLIVHGRRRQSCNNTSRFSSLTNSDRNYYYEKLYSFKERKKHGGLGKSRYECRGFEDKKKKQLLGYGNDDEVEIMLSLLTEEVNLEYFGVRDRKKINKKDTCCNSGKKKNVGTSVVKRDLKCDDNVVKNRSREEDKERETFTRRGNRGVRKEGSSCSSYYSFSSNGEFESDNDVDVKFKHDGYYVGESSSEYKKDHKGDYRKNLDEKVEEDGDKQRRFVKEQGEILKKNNTAEGYYGESVGVSQDLRKKSEKKLNEESSQHQSLMSVNNEENSQQHSQKVDRITDVSESIKKYKRFSEKSEIDNSVLGSASSSQKRYNDTEKNSNASIKESTSKHTRDSADLINRQDEYIRQSDVISKVSESQETDIRGTSSSLSEIRMKNWEDNSIEKHQKTGHLTRLKGSRVKSEQVSEISDTHITDTQNNQVSRTKSDIRMEKQEQYSGASSSEAKVTKGQQVAQRRTSNEEKYSTPGIELVEGTTETRNSGRTTKASSFHVGMPKEASSTYKALKLNPEPMVQGSGAHGGGTSGSHPALMAPSPEQESKGQLHVELTHEHSSEYYETVTGEVQDQTQGSSVSQRFEILGGDRSGDSSGLTLTFFSHEDALTSADQQQKSSKQFVGEFVEKARGKLSASEAQLETVKSSGQDGSGNLDKKDDGSRRSSRGSGPKGPSDEMWHETDASIQEPPETNAPDNTSSNGNGVEVKRNDRSLWNIIGDVVRLRWTSPRSETHTPKSGVKGSSNQSASSEAWFSGQESHDENGKKASTKSQSQSQSQSQREDSSSSSPKDKDSPLSPSKSMASAEIEESSFPLPAIRMRRSSMIKKSSEAGKTDASSSGKTVKTEQPVPDRLTEISPADASGSGKTVKTEQPVPNRLTETESKDGELKRRKLGRIDQVSRDKFDEWEEAYAFETKQRKSDELFMREALLEAKKAADVWEVPVGAVLVQGGKIIARGYNLVEELRDSTAHAEMICIREASSNLRSWRLSDTTLYVTLEPCPMCAGAILQARIDTVVWGAPNKLLGADGSWIRLFPDGDGGNGSESADKPPAPVHPFHPNITIRRGVLASQCADVMQQFFQLRRKKKTEPEPPTPPSSLPISHHHHHHSKFFSKMHDAFNIMFCL